MSIEVMNAVRERRFPLASRKLVLVTLANYCDSDWSCFVGQARLAADTGLGLRTVRRALDDLRDDGLITVTTRYGKTWGRTSNRTTINKAVLGSLPATVAGRDASLGVTVAGREGSLPANVSSLPATVSISTGHHGLITVSDPSEDPYVAQAHGFNEEERQVSGYELAREVIRRMAMGKVAVPDGPSV